MKFTTSYTSVKLSTPIQAKKKKNKTKNNPWAICTTSLDGGQDDPKFEKCVKDIKKKNHYHK